MSPRWIDCDSPPLNDGFSSFASSSSSSTYDRSSISSATSGSVGPRETPLSSPFGPPSAFAEVEYEYYPRAVPPPPPSPPQPQRVSALATFAAEQIAWLWFAPPGHHRPTKHQLVPTDKFLRFCHEILATTQISHSVVILALLYIHRLKQRNHIYCAPGSEFRTAIVGLMLANKTLDDNTYTARTWSDVSSLELKALVAGEAEFLLGLDFSLHVTESAFAGWIKLLEGHVTARKEQLSSSRSSASSARRRQGPGAPPDRELFGLGLSPDALGFGRRSSSGLRDGRRHSRGGTDRSATSRQHRPLPSLASFSFPSTPISDPSARSLVAPLSAPSQAPNGCSPLSSQTPPSTLRHPRLNAARRTDTRAHTRSLSASSRSTTTGFMPSKRSAADAELLEPSPPLNKRLAPAATWLARSFSAGASPAPTRSVYVLPRGPPAYLHAAHRLSLSSEFSPPAPTYPPPPPPPDGFRHLADGLQPQPVHKPESLAFYSLAAGQRQGVPRWTSTDLSYAYQYTPPHPSHPSHPLAHAAYGPPAAEHWDANAPRYLPAPPAPHAQGRYVKYANAGLPGVLWPSVA